MKRISKDMVLQTLRFMFVGMVNTAIDFAVFNVLAIYIIGLETSWTYFVCKSLAFIVAMINSFFMNSRFTFKHHAHRTGVWWRFAVITVTTFVISSVLSTLVFRALINYTDISALIAGNASVVVSVFLGMCINFLGYKYFVFQRHEEIL